MTNRSRIEIVSQILKTANRSSDDDVGGGGGGGDGLTQTRIMYMANLRHAQLKEYLMILTN